MAERVGLTGAKETLLMTLYLRAVDSRAAAPILGDPHADEVMSRIDYDFGRLARVRGSASTVAVRAKCFDIWTQRFLTEHPNAVVLHLACGLDSRVFRIDPPRSVLWFELDHPEVIRLRERLYSPRDGVHTIGASVTEESWWARIPIERPALVLAEGLLMYLSAPEVHRLLDQVTAHLPSGQLAFDAVAPWFATMSKFEPALRRAGTSFRWALRDPQEIERDHPRLRLDAQRPMVELLRELKLPVSPGITPAMMDLLPTAVRNYMQLLRYTF